MIAPAVPFNPLAPPRGEEARRIAERMGPADETTLEQLAQYAEVATDFVYGHVTAHRLRLLAQQLKQRGDAAVRLENLERDRPLTFIANALAERAEDEDVTFRVAELLDLSKMIVAAREDHLARAAADERLASEHIRCLQRIVAEMAEELTEKASGSDKDAHQSAIVFLFRNNEDLADCVDDALSVDLAVELALLLDTVSE